MYLVQQMEKKNQRFIWYNTYSYKARDVSGTTYKQTRDVSGTKYNQTRDVSGTKYNQTRDVSGTTLTPK